MIDSTNTNDSSTACQRHDDRCLRVSLFDQVTSFFAALILFFGTAVSVLLVLWLLNSTMEPMLVLPPQAVSQSTSNPPGTEQDFLPPSAAETIEINEPEVSDALLAVTDAASQVAGSIVGQATVTDVSREGERGDRRAPGPPMDGEVISRAERWVLAFNAQELNSYARQLDHYGIELGVIGGGIAGVDCVSELSSAQPKLRRVESESEQRLYFLWTDPSPLKRFDQELIRNGRFVLGPLAGQATQLHNRVMLKFVPPSLELQLAALELKYAVSKGHSSVDSIAQTVFTSSATVAGEYRFEVTQQRYKNHKP